MQRAGPEPGEKYYIRGRIVEVSAQKALYYPACETCKRKVENGKCPTCGPTKEKVTYAFDLHVTDGTGSVWIHIFGEDGEKILGVSAEEIRRMKEEQQRDCVQIVELAKAKVTPRE